MSAHTRNDGCGTDVAAYALGALTDDETRRFESHLQTCELCRTDLAQLRPVVDALPAAAEPIPPPAALKRRIMGVVEAEARERHKAAAPRRSRFGFLTIRPLPAMAAACVLLLAGIGIGIAVLSGGSDDIDGQCIRSCESVAMHVEKGHGTLKVEGMAQPPQGRVYQVWTQRYGQDPKATDALFTVDKDGSASVDVPGDTHGVDQVLVTDEPPGGSTSPTTAAYIAVRMS
ncbi:MAG TPA: anti-sigma factor [Solirubrobacteraceae bacterium]